MSAIEAEARPYLTPMIEGKRTFLDVRARRAIATWAALKVIGFAHSQRENTSVVNIESMEHVHQTSTCSPNWHVWLAAYDGALPAFVEVRSGINAHGIVAPGVVLNLIIGYLVFKVVGVNGARGHITRRDALSVAPEQNDLISVWPPENRFVDTNIANFLNLWQMSPTKFRTSP